MAAAPGKRVLRPETKGYVPKLMAAAIIAKHPEAFGFKAEEIEREAWSEYAEVEIPSATLLSVVAKAAGVSERDIIDLNPELRRSCTPPRKYTLKIPAAAHDTFAEAWPEIHAMMAKLSQRHVSPSTSTGTFPFGLRARCAGALCSPLRRSSFTYSREAPRCFAVAHTFRGFSVSK